MNTDERHRLLGYSPQGFALEVSPWQTKESINAAMLYRGVIVAGWAAVETDIIELAIRASRHSAYLGFRRTFPSRIDDRVKYLRNIANLSGPLLRYQSMLNAVLDRYEKNADLRNMMAHAKMRVLPNWGATLIGYKARNGGEIAYYEQRYTEEELQFYAMRAARFARAVNLLMARIEKLGLIPTAEDTRTPS